MDVLENNRNLRSHRCPACDGKKQVFDEEEGRLVDCTLCEGSGYYDPDKVKENDIINNSNNQEQNGK